MLPKTFFYCCCPYSFLLSQVLFWEGSSVHQIIKWRFRRNLITVMMRAVSFCVMATTQSQHCIINRAFPILFVPGETRTLWCRFILNHSVFYRRLNVSFRMTPVYLLGLLLVVYIPYMSETRLHLIFVSHSVRLFCSCRCCRHTLSLPPFKHHIWYSSKLQ